MNCTHNSAHLVSTHLVCGTTTDGGHYAYHSKFGNFTWVDPELHQFLSAPNPEAIHRLWQLDSQTATFLADSYFLVRAPDEEAQLISQLLRERRQQISTGYFLGGLQISSSNVCNFSCSYCFADASDTRGERRTQISKESPNITFERARHAIDEVRAVAARHGRDAIAVKFLGREPLVNWRVIEQLLAHYRDLPIRWAITTNGALITEEIAAALKEFNVLTVVSLDGPAVINDLYRRRKVQGGGTYDLVRRGMDRLAQRGVAFSVSSVVTDGFDREQMIGFVNQLSGFGASEFQSTLVMQTDRTAQQAADRNSVTFVDNLVALFEAARAQGLLVHGDWIDPFHRISTTRKFAHDRQIDRPLGVSCSASEHQISIEPTGDLFPCRAMSTHYGHVDDLDAVLRSEQYSNVLMRTFLNVPYCRGCELEGFCQGTCLGSSEQASGDIYDPQEVYCEVYRQTTRKLLSGLRSPRDLIAN